MKSEYDHLNNGGKRAHSRNKIKRNKIRRRRIMILAAFCVVLILGVSIFAINKIRKNNQEEEQAANSQLTTETADNTNVMEEENPEAVVEVVEDSSQDEKETEDSDPQAEVTKENGVEVNVKEAVTASNVGENSNLTWGIDVSRFQGTIDWAQVATSGIDFAMIRVGIRDAKTGEIKADTNAKYNMQEAEKNGIKIGAYFFSTAVTEAEAIEEADWVASYISKYPITYPVGYNCEGFENATSRQYNLTKAQRSTIAAAFLKEIYNKGYTPIFYASRNELRNDAKWNASIIEKNYKVWVAQYTDDTSHLDQGPAYSGKYAMWQYTNQGTIPGVSKKVDVDVAFFGYNGTETAKDTSERETATADVEALMKFTDCNESVTAKSKTNLRDKPSQGADSTVKVTLTNGQIATRTGISNSGWSRLVYEGGTYYAVSSYLTTDTSAPAQTTDNSTKADSTQQVTTPAPTTNTGFKTKFTDCNETITAKEKVNLRNKPSVTDPDSQVVATLYAGTTATRTGINNEYGWSRIVIDGQTLYCVSSYIKVVE
ncbi:Lyzozyme M1 (1,4-beta-N-acetylmuramidase), GH25 family [Pseudobutyrivibrio sp. YE44]|uniref:glycoside hydrolase family 25 protein n=1 Tax=Pseudobutyrivibrio sp. YE44 TaxID=1520802 RepID=UPI000887DEB0|nr:glycoside hydrolase family 25 protein [Pseudobutyrivibrio sp. YE44]SDB49320.1 Lyzozyme M1 (1,4-beta-N-acetylmuramidase), GH25 family [Pseudobutyrivibrio sp. YE44]